MGFRRTEKFTIGSREVTLESNRTVDRRTERCCPSSPFEDVVVDLLFHTCLFGVLLSGSFKSNFTPFQGKTDQQEDTSGENGEPCG